MTSSRTSIRILSATLGAMGIAFALSATAASPSESTERTNSTLSPSQSNTESVTAEDRAITERVKAALDLERDLGTAMLRVQTSNRQVLLSGGVETSSQRELAIQVASSVQGVGGVQDDIKLKEPKA